MKKTLSILILLCVSLSSFATERRYPYDKSSSGAKYVFTQQTLTSSGKSLLNRISQGTLYGCIDSISHTFAQEGDETVCIANVSIKLDTNEPNDIINLSRLTGKIGSSKADRVLRYPILLANRNREKDCGNQNPYLYRIWKMANEYRAWCE